MGNEIKIKCQCKGVEEAANKHATSLREAGMMDFVIRKGKEEILHGGWDKCICSASKYRKQGPWRILENEKPGKEFQSKDDKNFSVLMIAVVGQIEELEYYFVRWLFDMNCFMAEDSDQVVNPEKIAYQTKLWKPVTTVSEELWRSCFPVPEEQGLEA